MYEDRDGTHARDLFAPRPQDRDDGAGATYTATLINSNPQGGEVWVVTMPGSVRLARVEYAPHYATHPWQCNRCDPMADCAHVAAARAAREG